MSSRAWSQAGAWGVEELPKPCPGNKNWCMESRVASALNGEQCATSTSLHPDMLQKHFMSAKL